MSKGVVLFAQNNGSIDYVGQANYLAKRISKYLDLPTTLITDKDVTIEHNFDRVIILENAVTRTNRRRYYDGSLTKRVVNFNNFDRAEVYNLTPYDETIVMDTDYIICNDVFKKCFESKNDFQIYKKSYPLSYWLDTYEFNFISDTSVDFYWATVMFFRKTETNKKFFNLVKHIKENYDHYRGVFQISNTLYRNDFAFSIAIHIMNGYQKGSFAKELPGKMYYSIDRDILHSIEDDEIKILIEKQNYNGQYICTKVKGSNVHVMNKFSLDRLINEQ